MTTKKMPPKSSLELLLKSIDAVKAAHIAAQPLTGHAQYLELSKVYGLLAAVALESTALMADVHQEMKLAAVAGGDLGDIYDLQNITDLFKKKESPGSNN